MSPPDPTPEQLKEYMDLAEKKATKDLADKKTAQDLAAKKAAEIPIRVSLSRKTDEMIHNGGIEILNIDTRVANRRLLADVIKDYFSNLESSNDPLNRSNIPDRCVWSPNYRLQNIKAVWDTTTHSGSGWGNSMTETEITDQNIQATMASFKKCPPNSCALSVLIARKTQLEENC